MEIKLAEALLRRKELNEKVAQVRHVKSCDVYETKVSRRTISDQVDDIQASVPKIELSQVTAEYDYYARQLREIDAAIQRTNWTTDVQVGENNMNDYRDKVK